MSARSAHVVGFEEIDPTRIDVVGGKGAHLAELARLEGVRVPPGFCVTTGAFRRALSTAPSVGALVARLSRVAAGDREGLREGSAAVRAALEAVAIPDDVAEAIGRALVALDDGAAYAVRSSATAEDLPTASFAGQQDSYLNVVGREAIVERVRRCWASLFTERAVSYRAHNGFDHEKVSMAVVVQRMVFPEVAGVLFTADPVTSNRKVVSVEATFGLGEALVSGLVSTDAFKVRDDVVIERQIATKSLAIRASSSGGTEQVALAPERGSQPSLSDADVVRLAQLGRRVEAHFGHPQDIEWCLAGGELHLVQSRPITSLFPIPKTAAPGNRVYVSVGHQQMMTDPIRPLGISVWQLTAGRPMFEAGARLFVDVTEALASPASRALVIDNLGRSDPLIGDALTSVVERGFVPPPEGEAAPGSAQPPSGGPPAGAAPPPLLAADPDLVPALMKRTETSLATLREAIVSKSGSELFEFIRADLQELRGLMMDPLSFQALNAAFEGVRWLNEKLHEWLGEQNPADTLTQSVPHNVTSEMGLALLDVADVIRPHPEVVAFLERTSDDGFLAELPRLEGGREARDAIEGWLERYGVRCPGEIDVTRPRFRERPTLVLPMLLGNLKRFSPGEAARRFEQGRAEAAAKERDVLARLRGLDDGERKAAETKAMIDRVRAFMGYREYPKFGIVSRYFVYRRALWSEAERLVQVGVLSDAEDIAFLTFDELHDVVRTQQVDDELLRERKEAFRAHHSLTPPRVLTSEGECLSGRYRRDGLPAGALAGLAVSAGVIEGRARVIHDMAKADLEPGDILVTAFTDPSWTPLFVAIAGLVTEVGGLMTHGAVIAREYGLPAVVGVEGATRLLKDGQRIRVNGSDGYVEVIG